MKYFFIPFSLAIFFILAYYSLFLGMMLLIWMFSLSWIWLILGYFFLVGITSTVLNTIPSFIRNFIIRFYGLNWFVVIPHSLAGFLGVITFFYLTIINPPLMISGDDSTSLIGGFWAISKLKTFILLIPFLGILLGVLFTSVLSPIADKIRKSSEGNKGV